MLDMATPLLHWAAPPHEESIAVCAATAEARRAAALNGTEAGLASARAWVERGPPDTRVARWGAFAAALLRKGSPDTLRWAVLQTLTAELASATNAPATPLQHPPISTARALIDEILRAAADAEDVPVAISWLLYANPLGASSPVVATALEFAGGGPLLEAVLTASSCAGAREAGRVLGPWLAAGAPGASSIVVAAGFFRRWIETTLPTRCARRVVGSSVAALVTAAAVHGALNADAVWDAFVAPALAVGDDAGVLAAAVAAGVYAAAPTRMQQQNGAPWVPSRALIAFPRPGAAQATTMDDTAALRLVVGALDAARARAPWFKALRRLYLSGWAAGVGAEFEAFVRGCAGGSGDSARGAAPALAAAWEAVRTPLVSNDDWSALYQWVMHVTAPMPRRPRRRKHTAAPPGLPGAPTPPCLSESGMDVTRQ